MTIKQLKIDYIEGEKLKIHINADKKTVNHVRKILNEKMNCPDCDYDGGKYGHTKQLNPENPFNWICSACGFTFGRKNIEA